MKTLKVVVLATIFFLSLSPAMAQRAIDLPKDDESVPQEKVQEKTEKQVAPSVPFRDVVTPEFSKLEYWKQYLKDEFKAPPQPKVEIKPEAKLESKPKINWKADLYSIGSVICWILCIIFGVVFTVVCLIAIVNRLFATKKPSPAPVKTEVEKEKEFSPAVETAKTVVVAQPPPPPVEAVPPTPTPEPEPVPVVAQTPTPEPAPVVEPQPEPQPEPVVEAVPQPKLTLKLRPATMVRFENISAKEASDFLKFVFDPCRLLDSRVPAFSSDDAWTIENIETTLRATGREYRSEGIFFSWFEEIQRYIPYLVKFRRNKPPVIHIDITTTELGITNKKNKEIGPRSAVPWTERQDHIRRTVVPRHPNYVAPAQPDSVATETEEQLQSKS